LNPELVKQGKALEATFPLIGLWRRRSAVKALAESREDKDVIPLLAEGLRSADPNVSAQAQAALEDLNDTGAIDAFCSCWEKEREPRARDIIQTKGYVATGPARLKALSALKVGALALLREADTAFSAP